MADNDKEEIVREFRLRFSQLVSEVYYYHYIVFKELNVAAYLLLFIYLF